MEIRCRCTSCAAKFKVDAKYAGKKARCPKCQTIVEVPRENIEESTTSLSSLRPDQPLPKGSSPSGGTILPPPPHKPPAPSLPAGLPPLPHTAPVAPAASQPAAPIPQAPIPAPGPTPAPATPFPAILTTKASSSPAAVSPTTNAPSSPRGSKPPLPLPLILGGGLAAVALVAIGIVAVIAMSGPSRASGKKQGTTVLASAVGSATLHLDWPSEERRGGALSIDGKRHPLAAVGDLKLVLGAGSHQLYLQRRGYEPIETTITLTGGESRHFVPQWQASALAPAPAFSPTGGNPANPPLASGNFPLGSAVGTEGPKGFDGWLQNFETAKREAAAGGNKDILIVFGCSDLQPATQQLAASLLQAGVKNRLTCLVVDFPRTEDGFNRIEDRGQNSQMLKDFGLDRLPALALADARGRVYFLKEQWEEGFGKLQADLAMWEEERFKRDMAFKASQEGTEMNQVAWAVFAIKWMQEQEVWRFYQPEIERFLAICQRNDPQNQFGHVEECFEPLWFIHLTQADAQDEEDVLKVAAELDPWIERGGFKDHDRGAKLHMTAAMLLAQVERIEEATKQLEEAVKYQPKNSDLADAVNGLKTRLENKDIVGSGTGFLISPAGYVLTNHHVIDGRGRVEIRLPGTKETVPAEVVAQDDERDMALLKVIFPDPAKFQAVPVGTEELGRGSEVAAFGFPLGDTLGTGLKFTRGSIGGLPDATNEGMYLLDLRVNPGNSGGPLCDARGNVAGMITKKTGNFGFEDSYGMAIPSATLLDFLRQHLPEGTPVVATDPAAAALSWDQVDRKVSNGVLMILKRK